MKTVIKLILPLIFFSTISISFSQEDVSSKVITAIRAGNARALSGHFHATIDLTLSDNDGTYSKSQAEMIVKDFFEKNPPASFSVSHQGSSRDESHFYIGTYVSRTQDQFRIYFLLKSFSDKLLIQQLQILSQ
ncbi:MAG: DUF4783 domain-containing protein [Bacteroidales bacterium]|nr:DUF4783 domain-containing protein [Bacteroidales bacterium]